jgi:hypothetical protein
MFIRTLQTSAVKPWRWPAAMDACLGDVHCKWLLKKVPIGKRNEITSEASFRNLILDPFIKQIEGVLGEAENYRSIRFLKQLDTWSVAFYTEKVVQLHQKLQISEEDKTWIQLYVGGLLPEYISYIDDKSTKFTDENGEQVESANFGSFLQVQSLAKAAEQIKLGKKKQQAYGVAISGPSNSESKFCRMCERDGKMNVPYTLEHRKKTHSFVGVGAIPTKRKMFKLELENGDPERDPEFEYMSFAESQMKNEENGELNNIEESKESLVFVQTPIRIKGVDGIALVDSGAVGSYIQEQ